MEFLGNFINNWVVPNIGYILVFAGIFYIGIFCYSLFTGKGGSFKLKHLIAFTIILGIGIYCLVTGKNITDFIH